MESRGSFIDDRLDPETDFSGAVALGLCDIFADADSAVGRAAGYGVGRFCSPQSLVRMGSVVGVLEQVDTFLHTRESSGKRYVWDVREDGIFESFGIQFTDPNGGRWVGSLFCGLEISSGSMGRWILGIMGCDSVDLDGVQSSR